MKSGKQKPYSARENQLILECPHGELSNLCERLGRNYHTVLSHKIYLKNQGAFNKKPKKDKEPKVPVPFDRPAWFEEPNPVDMATKGR